MSKVTGRRSGDRHHHPQTLPVVLVILIPGYQLPGSPEALAAAIEQSLTWFDTLIILIPPICGITASLAMRKLEQQSNSGCADRTTL